MHRLAAALFLFAFPVLADDITGKPRIIDGDTVEIAGERIRLYGIDALELRQTCWDKRGEFPCGERARFMLELDTKNQEVVCVPRGKDRYGRTLAVCHAGGVDLGWDMVRLGWALAYRRYSMDYVADEKTAKVARKGLWRGEFVPP